ncbi:MAG: hypothetical protein WCC38_01675 [Pseudonocardiaceae bacterium]
MTAADLSPDGRSVVFALIRTDVEANTDHTDLFLLDVETGEQRQPGVRFHRVSQRLGVALPLAGLAWRVR